MTQRADAAAATGERILDAAVDAFWDSAFDPTIREVAERAGVSEQTVIRRFGNKEQLLEAAGRREFQRVAAQRDTAPSGDTAGALKVLVDHYEEHGEGALKMLANEDRLDSLREITENGRAYHQEWCERVFTDALRSLHGTDRKRRLAQLIAVTDVYTWKLLRIDRRLSRRQTELAMRELVESLTGGS